MLSNLLVRLTILLLAFSIITPAFAEEWGLSLGAHHTCATSRRDGATISGDFGIRTGIQTSFFLSPTLKLRTGAIYTQRHFDVNANGVSRAHDWDYLDLPALVQWNPKPGNGIFIGPVLAADKTGLIFLQAGVNFIFDNMYGFDFFYEMNPGPVDPDGQNLSAAGVNLLYYFL